MQGLIRLNPCSQVRARLPWFLEALPSEQCAKGGAGGYSDALQRDAAEPTGIAGLGAGAVAASAFRISYVPLGTQADFIEGMRVRSGSAAAVPTRAALHAPRAARGAKGAGSLMWQSARGRLLQCSPAAVVSLGLAGAGASAYHESRLAALHCKPHIVSVIAQLHLHLSLNKGQFDVRQQSLLARVAALL